MNNNSKNTDVFDIFLYTYITCIFIGVGLMILASILFLFGTDLHKDLFELSYISIGIGVCILLISSLFYILPDKERSSTSKLIYPIPILIMFLSASNFVYEEMMNTETRLGIIIKSIVKNGVYIILFLLFALIIGGLIREWIKRNKCR